MIFCKEKSFNAKLIKTASNMQLVHSTFFTKDSQSGILLPNLFWPTVGKNCSSNR